jgi:CheY-like chemotaxis protein
MEAIGQLAGGVAHDFNNLLTVITGYCQMLLRALTALPREHGRVAEVLRAAQQASSLTQQLLAFSRKQVLQPLVLDVNGHVQSLQEMLQRLIGEQIALTTSLAEPPGLVKADPSQIEQVIVNLVVNARDAMPQGGEIRIATRNVMLTTAAAQNLGLAEGAYVTLSVEDTGTGIPLEIQERIFEPFFTTKLPGRGTGLGLSTVYGIISQSGGLIRLASVMGRGTTFTIYLPQIEAPADGGLPSVEAVIALRRATERVLIVEDAADVRRLAATILTEQGYTVTEASSAQEALTLLERPSAGPFDIILSDIVMPGMNGVEFRRQATEQHPGIPIILMSGYTDHSLLQDAGFQVAEPYLGKPFTTEALLGKIQTVLDARSRAKTPSAVHAELIDSPGRR